jgi:uncharacterized membrane protein
MLWLAALFAGLVLLTSRLQGLRALARLAASLAVIVFLVVPAILSLVDTPFSEALNSRRYPGPSSACS